MIKLILVRHGESVWNLKNKFTGWTDVELTQKGEEEAKNAGKVILENNIKIDEAFTSYLVRAKKSLEIIKKELKQKFPVYYSWKINERHYGALQGLNKQETAQKYGDEQVKLWRRSAETRPPLLDKQDERNPKFDELYKDVNESLPLGESLLDTKVRVVDYFENFMKNHISKNQCALIVAHGNSLRALIQYLDNILNSQIMNVEIKTGEPIIYELNDNFSVINHYILK